MANELKDMRSFTLQARQVAIVQALADERFEGNQSMALRFIISHFESCQFPLLGLSVELAQADTPVQ